MSKPLKKISLKMPTLEEDQLITAAAESDPDALPLTDKQMSGMVPITVLRGRPKLANKKKLISIRYSPEVIDYFRASGAGWQARMDTVLKEYVEAHSSGDAKGAQHQDSEDGCEWCRLCKSHGPLLILSVICSAKWARRHKGSPMPQLAKSTLRPFILYQDSSAMTKDIRYGNGDCKGVAASSTRYSCHSVALAFTSAAS